MCASVNQVLMLIACVAGLGVGELFTSMAHLQTALYAERDIALEIRQHLKQEEERLASLRRIADSFEQHSSANLENHAKLLGNPVNAYLFVKHFTLDWDREILPKLSFDSGKGLKERIEKLKEYLPTYEDLQGTVSALLRLQDVYKLDTSEIARGDLGGVQSTELSGMDCFELGKLAYNDEDYYHTILWMEEALEKNKHASNQSVDSVALLDYMAFASFKQGNVKHALRLTNEMLELEPGHERAVSNKQYYEKMIEQEEKNSRKRGDDGEVRNVRQIDEYRQSEEFANYEALCRGETIMPNKYAHRLKCRYRNNGNPLLMLQPMKEEEVYLDPWLVIFHDILSDHEMEIIKAIATPKLQRATIQNPQTGKLEFANYRVSKRESILHANSKELEHLLKLGRATVHNAQTGKLETATYRVSKSAWLTDSEHQVIRNLNQRVQAVTGLTMSTAEELQIANYGIGGHYEPHFDFARRRESTAFEKRVGNRIATFLAYKEEVNAFKSLGTGNRIATVIFYMTDVEAGGATVFPYIGVKLFPKKGIAAFWYNLYKNGEGIYNTRHAACPVLVGEKWVSNKWIHERGQEFRRPCGLREEE